MSGVETTKPEACHLQLNPVDSPNTQKSLNALLDLLSSCSGPEGGIHMVQNSSGGHITMTSDTQRLLGSVSISNQVLKLIVSFVQGHLKQFGDGGKFLTCSCLQLIKLTLDICKEWKERRIYCALYEKFVQIISNYLNSDVCMMWIRADFTNVNVLLAYAQSLLKTRPLLHLGERDCGRIAELVVRCFVESIPEQKQNSLSHDLQSHFSDNMYITTSLHEHPRDSRLLKGMLLQYPDLPSVKGTVMFNIKKIDCVDDVAEHVRGNTKSCIKLALITCSMSGDLEELVSATYEVTPQQATSVEADILEDWSALCRKLTSHGVGLLLCQKVIHPQLKYLLKMLGLVAVERLGSAVLPYIQDLTGVKPIASVYVAEPQSLCGFVSQVEHVILDDKSYLHLHQPTSPMVTLILCSRTQEATEELKCCVKMILSGLFSLSKEGRLLSGGGCWQIHCSYVLAEKVREQLSSLARDVGCSEARLLSALSVFRSAVFHRWAQQLHNKGNGCKGDVWDVLLADPVSKHCWRERKECLAPGSSRKIFCSCGLKSADLELSTTFMNVRDNIYTSYHSFKIFNNSLSSMKDSKVECKTSKDSNGSFGSPAVFNVNCAAEKCSVNVDYNNHGKFDNVSQTSETCDIVTPTADTCMDISVSSNTVLDHFSAVTQALCKAVFTANVVLSLGQVITDA